jgi:hypothetical protein
LNIPLREMERIGKLWKVAWIVNQN